MSGRIFIPNADLSSLREKLKTIDRAWADDLRQTEPWYLLRELGRLDDVRYRDSMGNFTKRSRDLYVHTQLIFHAALYENPESLQCSVSILEKYLDPQMWGTDTDYNPGFDLKAGRANYVLSLGYDLLHEKLTDTLKRKIIDRIRIQNELMADYFHPDGSGRHTFEQNHFFIPATGLYMAACVFENELNETARWRYVALTQLKRSLLLQGTDGYYYEGFDYMCFALIWLAMFLHIASMKGDIDLMEYQQFSKFKHYFMAAIMPNGKDVMDFGDTALNHQPMNIMEMDTRPFNYYQIAFSTIHLSLLYFFAHCFHDSESLAIAQYYEDQGWHTSEPFWNLIWYDEKVKPVPMEQIRLSHYFDDHEVYWWRSSLHKDHATAFIIRCGPPEGHSVADYKKKWPDWYMNAGHVHPDAGHFILYSNQNYLFNDTGYLGVKETRVHNTLLIDGIGQVEDGQYHVYPDHVCVDYDILNKMTISVLQDNEKAVKLVCNLAPAYTQVSELKSLLREVVIIKKIEGIHNMENCPVILIRDRVHKTLPGIYTCLYHVEKDIMILDDSLYHIKQYSSECLIKILNAQDKKIFFEDTRLRRPGRNGQGLEDGEVAFFGKKIVIENTYPESETEFLTVLIVNWSVDEYLRCEEKIMDAIHLAMQ